MSRAARTVTADCRAGSDEGGPAEGKLAVRVRIASWNLCSCRGTDGRLDPARVATVLESIDADMIGLQEVDWRHPPFEGRDQLAYLATRLGMHPVAGPNLRDHRGDYGNGLLTRFVPESTEQVDLSFGRREPRGAIDAVFRCHGFSLRVIVTHLGLGRAEHARQVALLRQRIREAPSCDAVVLAGDLNEWRPKRFDSWGLVPEPFPAATRVRTYPSRFPILALDRILAFPEPVRFGARAVATPLARVASDHLPIVADLEFSCGARIVPGTHPA